ncbi:hypothetical protein EUGRSUZ_B02906 [Eucalyptus grandis]|uniref:Uncharacterized protein n=2 Tax=Eucalyptus grandis TaxID=71139 RepID=A0ACC3LUR1_EUCGR|nr:hypothetical protein EUGRSUZ_B02906 [Eucalyptus grandis]
MLFGNTLTVLFLDGAISNFRKITEDTPNFLFAIYKKPTYIHTMFTINPFGYMNYHEVIRLIPTYVMLSAIEPS